MFGINDDRKVATVLAALRFWQQHGPKQANSFFDRCSTEEQDLLNEIRTNGGEFEEDLSLEEIDALCEEINCPAPTEVSADYWLIQMCGGLDPELHGPYATGLEQAKAAVKLHKEMDEEDNLFWMDTSPGYQPECGTYSGGFFDDPEPFLAEIEKLEAQNENTLDSKLRRYVRDGGTSCPFCGNEDIVGDSYDHEEGFITQEIICSRCEKSWQDVLTLTGVKLPSYQPAQLDIDKDQNDAEQEASTVVCCICHKPTPANTAHLHQNEWIGECCWDNRLRHSE